MKSPRIPAPGFLCWLVRPSSGAAAWLCGTTLFVATMGSLQAQDTPPATEAILPDSFAPVEYPIDRYQKLRGKSPFEFELAKPPVGETVDPFAEYVLAGFAGSAGQPTVYLLNTKTQERITVLSDSSGRPNKSGFHIISVDRGRTLSSTTVQLEKDGQQGKLAFDSKALYSMTGGASGGGARPGQPNQPGQPVVRPGGVPGRVAPAYQAPQAFIPGQANRPAGQFPVATAGQPGVAPQPVAQGMQPGAVPANPQQQVKLLLNNPAAPNPAPQPNVVPVPGGAPDINQSNPQPRRRVVLPTTP
jgi:hypothetical protein